MMMTIIVSKCSKNFAERQHRRLVTLRGGE